MIMGDTFTPHMSPTTNIITYLCPCGKATCIIPTPIVCSLLTVEDQGGIGHPRILFATTKTVLAFKLPIGRVTDKLGAPAGYGGYPCSSRVTYGSPTVMAG